MQVFSNNAATTLAAELSAVATSMTVTASTGFASLAAGEYEMVTLDNGASREIIKVTARTGDTWTVARAQEGTTAAIWDAGVAVEARATAGTLAAFVSGQLLMAYNAPGGNAPGNGAVSMQPVRSDPARVASGVNAVAIGSESRATGALSTAMGGGAYAAGESGTAIGALAQSLDVKATAIGGSTSAAENSAAVGFSASANGLGATACGYLANATGDDSTSLGARSEASGTGATAVGPDAAARADNSIALGAYAWPNDPHIIHTAALPRHIASNEYWYPDPEVTGEKAAYLSSPVVSVMSEPLDLSAAGSATISLPPNTQFFVDTIGLIVVSASAPTGTPAISAPGLTSSVVTVTAQGERQLWKDIDADAVTGTMTIAVDTALTSGAMSARVYLSGIAVETE